jgi:hypothetical protein
MTGFNSKREAASDKLQKPVATKNNDGVTLHLDWDDLPVGTKLYTTPPKREWANLTEQEWLNLGCSSVEEVRIGLAIQAKLKEKNT